MQIFRLHAAFNPYKSHLYQCVGVGLLVLLVSFATDLHPWHGSWRGAPVALAQSSGPTLTIPNTLTATVATSVTVPIAFAKHGQSITSVVFSIDFDESCLAFDPTDRNSDSIPDAVKFTIPAQFQGLAMYNQNDTQGEIDIVIADYSLPFATLPDTEALLAISFSTLCTPALGNSQFAYVRFAAHPQPSFGNTGGLGVAGTTNDGGVEIQNPVLPSATPTLSTPAPPTPTIVSIDPTTPTPVSAPTLTPEPTTTSVIAPTFTPEPTTPPVGEAVPGQIYLPLVAR